MNVAIIGAGPYGLSIAAHLKGRGVECQVFGTPMSFWRDSMPPGMHLKSEGPASDLFDPQRQFPIEAYYNEISRPFVGRVVVPADVFVGYGEEFGRRFVPDVDLRDVAQVTRSNGKFILRLNDGTSVRSTRVVIATGIRDYAHLPDVLRGAPRDFVTHSCEYGPVDQFAGREVVVLGSGASAVDLAWSIAQGGGHATLVSRRPKIKFSPEPPPRRWRDSIRSPDTPIGGGWALLFYASLPNLFRHLPEERRRRIVATTLGPAPGWFMTDRVRGNVPILGGLQPAGAEIVKDRIKMTMKAADGQEKTVTADHVVAATGYRVNIDRLAFLDESIKTSLRRIGEGPVLSANFESSEPGLYFVGAASAETFGPVMRFVAGAGFTARTLSRRFASPRLSLAYRSRVREPQVAT